MQQTARCIVDTAGTCLEGARARGLQRRLTGLLWLSVSVIVRTQGCPLARLHLPTGSPYWTSRAALRVGSARWERGRGAVGFWAGMPMAVTLRSGAAPGQLRAAPVPAVGGYGEMPSPRLYRPANARTIPRSEIRATRDAAWCSSRPEDTPADTLPVVAETLAPAPPPDDGVSAD